MVVETLRFRLVVGADPDAFRVVDDEVQQRFAHHQRGLLRRMTACSADGAWLVVDLWSDAEAADRCDVAWAADPVAEAFMAFVDPATVESDRFQTVD